MLKLVSFAESDIGRVRAVNQDSFFVDEKRALFIVADGMGGHAGGEIASQLCVQEIVKFLDMKLPANEVEKDDSETKEALALAINRASMLIYERALEDPSLKGMGTTATVLKVIGKRGYFAHVGDSRLYLHRAGFLYQLTNDHSLVSEQVRAGVLTEAEAELHQLRNVITRSVGYQEQEDVDTQSILLEVGDVYLLCSDGLYGKVTDQEIAKQLSNASDISVKQLITQANNRGGEDNITALVLRIDSLP
ncbi:MAG: Stp1/IreP family PP2C-type Ser/Thr phosphatase [Oligoflexales bacterium]|nr:Stp1/IreP family PP2C-type Ser/Thr phosphatase [Oligoflexales bacterium]